MRASDLKGLPRALSHSPNGLGLHSRQDLRVFRQYKQQVAPKCHSTAQDVKWRRNEAESRAERGQPHGDKMWRKVF